MIFGQPWAVLVIAVIVGILSAGRLTRLVVNDHWPPIERLRNLWDANSERLGGWWLLLHCPWCFGPWMAGIVGLWAVIDCLLDGVIDWPWWAFNGWLAGSYVVSWIVFHDEDGSEEHE